MGGARGRVWAYSLATFVALAGAAQVHAQPITPDNPGPGDLLFTINSGAQSSISEYIYGVNFYTSAGFSNPVTLDRLGGNRWTGYNWETNHSNAGADYYHHNDTYLVGGANNTPPGEAVRPSLVAAANNNRGLVVTVPIAGYVSADANGTVDETQVAPSSRWRELRAKKDAVYPGVPLSTTPNETDNYVFTDEFVNWVETTRNPNQQVFYSLDNEPGIWGAPIPPGWQSGNPSTGQQPTSRIATHPLIHPYKATFAEMRDKTVAHAGAIKDVDPDAIVFGAVSYGYAEFTSLQGASDATTSPSHPPPGNQGGELNYLEWLLREVRTAEVAQGRKLMDALDVHWYPEVYANNSQGQSVRVNDDNSLNPSQAIIDARVQMTRSLWDATYTEPNSWITGCCSGGPIKLLKHLQRDVDDFASGLEDGLPETRIAITEYNYGGGRHISGGVAQADVLGIFGRDDVFAATLWPLSSGSQSQFAAGAFKMYLDYDGAAGSGRFGDLSIDAATDDIAESAVYASLDSDDPTRMILVAINRTMAAKDVALSVTHDRRFDLAEVYRLTSASSNPVRTADLNIDLVNAFHYNMPALSVTTLVLRSFGEGDFDLNGVVNAADLTRWQANAGKETGALFREGDNDRDGDVDGDDLLAWQRNLGTGSPITPYSTAVPEPSTLGLAALILPSAACIRRAAARTRRIRIES